MRNPDDSVDPDSVSVLAHDLNIAMARDASARKRYAEIYGAEWQPLGTVGGMPYFGIYELALPVYDEHEHTEQESYPFDTVNLRRNH